MFNYIDLPYEYSLEAIGGASTSQKFITGQDDDVRITVYNILKAADKSISFSVYSTGLVLYVEQSSDKITFRTNLEFIPGDDGNYHLSK